MDNYIEMKAEWQAWQDVVRLWPGDINKPEYDKLVNAIQLWGEHLVALRLTQTPEVREKAFRMHEITRQLAEKKTPIPVPHPHDEYSRQ